MQAVQLSLGTMNFGPQVNPQNSELALSKFLGSGNREIDTAHVYNGGQTETILGELLESPGIPAFSLATKVSPRVTGKLDEAAITVQLEESLRRLRRSSVDLLYLHFPDPATDLEITLAACAKLHKRGLFRELGMSNYPAWQVVQAWQICTANDWPKPSVYQGLYNGISRNTEPELFPALREYGLRFFAYNPLAGGLLTGRYFRHGEVPEPGRFTLRKNYVDRYWKKSLFEATRLLVQASKSEGIVLAEAALRWLSFHSALDGTRGDGIVLGFSLLDQLDQNLKALERGSLPKSVVAAFESAWTLAKPDSPSYFRVSDQ